MNADKILELSNKLIQGDRRSLARAITLVESTRPEDGEAAQRLLKTLLPKTGRSIRIGISGVPGAGKSTFIESFGMHLITRGLKPAVLAVDPSSTVTGGSIMGDKTRMQRLSAAPEAYIRPSPSKGTLGGVARRTRETILMCEAAGYDVILVETVGVGQSEVEVASMTDFYMLLMLPNAGDELQGIKKGVLELTDCIVVNKIDTDRAAANRTRTQLTSALHFMRPRTPDWEIPILGASALEEIGLEEIYEKLKMFEQHTGRDSGTEIFQGRRRRQNQDWMWKLAREEILQSFMEHPGVIENRRHLEDQVALGKTTPVLAARELVRRYREE